MRHQQGEHRSQQPRLSPSLHDTGIHLSGGATSQAARAKGVKFAKADATRERILAEILEVGELADLVAREMVPLTMKVL